MPSLRMTQSLNHFMAGMFKASKSFFSFLELFSLCNHHPSALCAHIYTVKPLVIHPAEIHYTTFMHFPSKLVFLVNEETKYR